MTDKKLQSEKQDISRQRAGQHKKLSAFRMPSFKMAVVILFAAAVLSGVVFRLRVPDCGIAGITSINDIKAKTVNLYYAWGSSAADSFEPERDEKETAAAPVIAVVSPTGKIRQTDASMGQEFIIEEVIKGADQAGVGETCWLYQSFGFRAMDGKARFMNTLNVMNTDYKYLVFMEESPLNEYTGQQPVYLLQSEDFGYIRIGGADTKTLELGYPNIDFLDLKEYEFFSASEKVTEKLNRIRADLLHEYYPAYQTARQ